MNAVPVFEAKNRLPFFIRKAETEGPVPISRRNTEVAYIVSKEDFEAMNKNKKKSIVDRLQERRKEYGLEDDDFDFSEHLERIRQEEGYYEYYGRPESEHIFDEV